MKPDHVPHLLTTTETAEPASDTYAEISARAYEIYVERGQEDGHDLEDWLQAESEVTARKTRSAAA